jgi:hydroxymethylbilane synthase
MRGIVVASRGSRLARAQALQVIAALRAAHPSLAVEHRIVKTSGDRDRATALRNFGAKGAFTKELEDLLLAGAIDLAVHSLKDLPTQLPPGLALAAVPRREEARDALCGAALERLPAGARVGTGSPRRAAQLRRLRRDVELVPLRGNVPTRLGRLAGADGLDAVVLAAAGLRRLGLAARIAALLPVEAFPPAPGQGALGLEIRAGDAELRALLAPLHDPDGAAAVRAERALLEALGGGCSAPVGAHAHPDGAGALVLRARVTAPDGAQSFAVRRSGDRAHPLELGRAAARALLDAGAGALLAALRPPESP